MNFSVQFRQFMLDQKNRGPPASSLVLHRTSVSRLQFRQFMLAPSNSRGPEWTVTVPMYTGNCSGSSHVRQQQQSTDAELVPTDQPRRPRHCLLFSKTFGEEIHHDALVPEHSATSEVKMT